MFSFGMYKTHAPYNTIQITRGSAVALENLYFYQTLSLRSQLDSYPPHNPKTEKFQPAPITEKPNPSIHKNYQTVPCRHFRRGFCERGENCGFKH